MRETTDESPCMKFAKEFLPVVDKALSTAERSSTAKPLRKRPEAEPAKS